MSLEKFEKLNEELKPYTNELAYHVLGDPLVLSNLKDYLDISYKNALKVNITTTAYNLNEEHFETLMHKGLKQINFSLNSYNANSHKKTLREYLSPIISYLQNAILKKQNHFINLRIWNLDDDMSAKAFNKEVFFLINEAFKLNLNIEDVYNTRPKNIRIASKVFFNFDDYFDWPSLQNEFVSDKGFCYGLDSHFAVLASGDVIPCCLDKDAVINLGNVKNSSIKSILESKRALLMKEGFKNKEVIEELCKHCTYRKRFD